MPETTETTTETPPEPIEPTDTAPETPAETTVQADPPPPVEKPAPPAPPPQQVATIDIDAELTKKESLATQLEVGTITFEDYAKQTAAVDRNIAKAQRLMMEPARAVQQTMQAQEQINEYWKNWGKGEDVAQTHYGKNISAARAKVLYQQAKEEFEANPRYQRREFAGQYADSLIYDKFIDALVAESKKKPAAGARPADQARASGAGGASPAPSSSAGKTARQRLEDGDYDLSGDAQRLGMM